MEIFLWYEVGRGLKLLWRLCPKGIGLRAVLLIFSMYIKSVGIYVTWWPSQSATQVRQVCKVFTFHLALNFVKVSSCWTKYFTIPLSFESFEGWNYLFISIAAWNYVRKMCVSGLHFFGKRKFFLPFMFSAHFLSFTICSSPLHVYSFLTCSCTLDQLQWPS